MSVQNIGERIVKLTEMYGDHVPFAYLRFDSMFKDKFFVDKQDPQAYNFIQGYKTELFSKYVAVHNEGLKKNYEENLRMYGDRNK